MEQYVHHMQYGTKGFKILKVYFIKKYVMKSACFQLNLFSYVSLGKILIFIKMQRSMKKKINYIKKTCIIHVIFFLKYANYCIYKKNNNI